MWMDPFPFYCPTQPAALAPFLINYLPLGYNKGGNELIDTFYWKYKNTRTSWSMNGRGRIKKIFFLILPFSPCVKAAAHNRRIHSQWVLWFIWKPRVFFLFKSVFVWWRRDKKSTKSRLWCVLVGSVCSWSIWCDAASLRWPTQKCMNERQGAH